MKLTELRNLLGEDRLCCIDVGAAGGIPAEWQSFKDLLTVDAFDPDTESHEPGENDSGNCRWYPVALGERTEKRKFYVLNRPTGSSFYPPNEALMREISAESYYKVNEVKEVETLGLSDFLRQHGRPKPNVIKLDTQGSELEILRSLADKDWSEVALVVSEVEFEELYQGQPLFHDVDGFMRNQGFRLFDLRTSRNYLSGRGQLQDYLSRYFNLGVGRIDYSAKLYAGDALYVRDWRNHDMSQNNRWLKLILSLLLYKYYDFPVYFSELAQQQGVLDTSQQEQLRTEIISVAPRPFPHQRADAIGRMTRRALRLFGYDGCYQAFWLKRSIPNQ